MPSELARAKRRPTGATKTQAVPSREGVLSANHLTPGDAFSHHHYESAVRGLLPNSRGREKQAHKFCGGSIFADHASGYISVSHQVSLGASDTLAAKILFEQQASHCGVQVKHYHTDNGIFSSSAFHEELRKAQQTVTFSGVGSHFQNAIAERAIQNVVYSARAMMIHAAEHWPDEFDAELWPFALTYAAWIHNYTPRRDSKLSPMEIFTGSPRWTASIQCCRFSNDPRQPHEQALKHIGRYLLGTRKEGLYIKLLNSGQLPSLDCYCNADFAGLLNSVPSNDPTCVRSRTGYIITFAEAPVVWRSVLQTEIATSTMESEYIACSTAMRALIPLRRICLDYSTALRLPFDNSFMISTVWEDNQACLNLATTDPPRLTPRSKHIGVKYHWFRSSLSSMVHIRYIASSSQKADIATKALSKGVFEQVRKLVLGWGYDR